MKVITTTHLKIAHLKSKPHPPGANEFNISRHMHTLEVVSTGSGNGLVLSGKKP